VWSDSLQKGVRLRVSTYALRTIEKRGGIDGYLMTARDSTMAPEFKRLKKQVQAAARSAPKPDLTFLRDPGQARASGPFVYAGDSVGSRNA